MKILTYPHEMLRRVCKPVEPQQFDEAYRLGLAMISIMRESDGIGLAANQVGINLRLIVVRRIGGDLILVNPRILPTLGEPHLGREGCLSLPGVQCSVRRFENIMVQGIAFGYGYPTCGVDSVINFTGLVARTIQHEIDHLNGKLLIDHLEALVDEA